MEINHDENAVILDHELYQKLMSLATDGAEASGWLNKDIQTEITAVERIARHVSRFNPHIPNGVAYRHVQELREAQAKARYRREVVKASGTNYPFYVRGMYGIRYIYVPVKIIGRAQRSMGQTEQMIAVEPVGVTDKLLNALDLAQSRSDMLKDERGLRIGVTALMIAFVWSERQRRSKEHRRPIFKVLPENLFDRLPDGSEPAPEAHHGTLDYLITGCFVRKRPIVEAPTPAFSPNYPMEDNRPSILVPSEMGRPLGGSHG
jgi:hypothetical protein